MKLKINISKVAAIFLVAIISCLPTFGQDFKADLEDFREIKTFSGVEVIFIPSQENSITITGHSKNEVKFDVVEGRLEIRLPIDHIWSDDNTLIYVRGRAVEIIDANEASVVETEGVLKGSGLVFRAQEGATIMAQVSVERVSSKVVSGATIVLQGNAREQEVEVNTGAKFIASELRTEDTEITVGTAGRGEIYVTDYCKATAKLGGIIEISGNPDQLDTKTSLGGKIL